MEESAIIDGAGVMTVFFRNYPAPFKSGACNNRTFYCRGTVEQLLFGFDISPGACEVASLQCCFRICSYRII